MKKNWFKSNRTVKNPAQAGDACLALYYEEHDYYLQEGAHYVRVTNVHTKEKIDFSPLYLKNHVSFSIVTLEFWGVTTGIQKIQLRGGSSLYDSVKKTMEELDFGHQEIARFTHVILKTCRDTDEQKGGSIETIDIYRLDDVERNSFWTKSKNFWDF